MFRYMKKKGVIGLGNPLRHDDGVGILLLSWVRVQKKYTEYLECVDGGTGGMSLLHELALFESVLIIDAVDFGGHPGAVRCFSFDDLQDLPADPNREAHETDLLKVLRLSEQLSELPANLMIFGVQPKELSPGTGISDTMRRSLQKIQTELARTLDRFICQ
jgi:hydrogenase maturation protease